MKLTHGLLLFIVSFSLSAQSAKIDSTDFSLKFDELTVTANRIDIPFSSDSRSIVILQKKQIENLAASSVNELLQVVAGVDLRQRGVHGVQGDLSIRGGTFEQSLLLVNGIRLTDPQTGHHMMNLPVSIEDIERIEILKGPAARIYGQNAFAGAVNIVTKIHEDFGAKLRLDYGQYDLQQIHVNTYMPIGKYKQTLSGSYSSSDGYKYNTDYLISNLFYQSEYDYKVGKINLLAGFVDRDFGANGFYGNENFTDQFESVQTWLLSASANHQKGDWTIKPRISFRNNKDNWQFRREEPEFFQNFHESKVLTSEIHSSFFHDLGVLGFGVEHNYMTLESSNLKDENDNGSHLRHQLGIHAENRIVLAGGKLDITPGILGLYITDYNMSFYPGVDIGYGITDKIKLFSNVGWTARIPSFTDLYYKDSGNVGNPELTEERAFTYEFGVKYSQANHFIQASIFNRIAKDQIDWFRISEEEKWMPDNFNEAKYRGFDIAYNTNFSAIKFVDFLSISYVFLHAEFEKNQFEYSRNQLENLRHQLVVQPQFKFGKLGLNMVFKYNDRVSLEDYYTIDANLSYHLRKHKIYLKVDNLTDQRYRETNLVEMPGRWISGGAVINLIRS